VWAYDSRGACTSVGGNENTPAKHTSDVMTMSMCDECARVLDAQWGRAHAAVALLDRLLVAVKVQVRDSSLRSTHVYLHSTRLHASCTVRLSPTRTLYSSIDWRTHLNSGAPHTCSPICAVTYETTTHSLEKNKFWGNFEKKNIRFTILCYVGSMMLCIIGCIC
jgi:hypothetical protein